jgi:hypothetical protein
MKAQYVINALDKAGIEIEMSLTTTGPVTSHRVKIDNISFWIKTRQGEIVSLEKRTGYTDADCDQVVEKIRTCKAFVSAILSARTTITPETEGDWMSQQGGCCVCKDTEVLVDKLDNVFCENCAEQDQEDSPENWDNSEVEFEKNAVDLEVQVKQAATGLVTAAVEYKPLDKKTAHQAHAEPTFNLTTDKGAGMIDKYKDMVKNASWLFGTDSPAYHIAELSASVAYTGCILLEAPRVYKDYLRAKMVFKGAGYPEYAGAVDNLYRGMRNEPNNESIGLDPGVSTTL